LAVNISNPHQQVIGDVPIDIEISVVISSIMRIC